MHRLRTVEELAWMNGSRFYTLCQHISVDISSSMAADRQMLSAFLTATSRLAFTHIDETCRMLALDIEAIGSTPKFAIRCAGKLSSATALLAVYECCCLHKHALTYAHGGL